MSRGAAITGWGGALPDQIVTNADFAGRLDTSDEWITERTGIKERRFGGTAAGLGTQAGRMALDRAGLTGSDIDLVILATTTPDLVMPATSSIIAHDLGITGGAMDLNAACAGFVYALGAAHGLILGGLDRVLVVGSDLMDRITDQDDRSTAILFASGAGAVVLQAVAGEDRILSLDFGVDGSVVDILKCHIGETLTMEGREVFRRAVRVTVDSVRSALERAKVAPADIALFIPHQANLRIIEAVNQRIGIPLDRTAVVLATTGNTSSASIPLALDDALAAGRVQDGDLVLMSGFGAGMTWATAVVRWGA
ncbi:MAG: beta-ketoacyl-ACP synthase III [Acidimicrobiales bacterium]